MSLEIPVHNAFQLAQQLYDVEVEARIKGPIVREDTVKKLLRKYEMYDGNKYVERRNKATSGSQTVVFRCIDGGNVVCKSKVKSIKSYNHWTSIVVSTEVDLNNNEMLAKRHFVETTKTRYSRMLSNNIRLDITYLHDDDTYQVEVEALRYDCHREFIAGIQEVVDILQDSPMYISRKKFDMVRSVVGGEGYYHSVTATINNKGSIDVDCTTDFAIYLGKYQKPITLTKRRLRNIFTKNMFMTPKLDGVRRFIISLNGMIYDMDPEHMHVRLLSDQSPYHEPYPSIVDAELVDGIYNIFDMCVHDGWYVGYERLSSRLSHLETWLDTFSFMNFVMKEYEMVPDENPVEHIYNFYNKYLDSTIPVDGIVFVNEFHKYTKSVIKWKPYITVDLVIHDNILDERVVANTIDTTLIPKTHDGSMITGNGVYEFEIVGTVEDDTTTKLDLKALRFRDDKKKPNSSNVIVNNVDGLSLRNIWNGQGCILMRQYHNTIKRNMLKTFAKGCTILDVGSGQGGDVSKWHGMRKVYCVEPSRNAVKELKSRILDANMKHIKVICCDVANTNKIYKRVKRVDVLTLFFTINLFKQHDLDALVDIVSKYQPKHIIGTCLERSLVKFSENTCYKITPNSSSGYHITLVDTRINQDEFFFSIDQLSFKGYKLVTSRQLNNAKIISANEKELSAMFLSFHFRK
jgi:hypothetical protein